MQREKTMLIADDVELNRALLENIFDDEYSILQDVEAAEKAGMNGFLAKPVDVKKMQDMIEKFCRASVVYGNRQEKNEEGL